MRSNQQRYTLHKEPTNQTERDKKRDGKKWKGIWYVRWRTPDGSWSTKKSTGHRNKSDAISWCNDQLESDPTAGHPETTIGDYTGGLFDWPDGRYVIDRRAGGHRVSYTSTQAHRTNLRNHVLRLIPESTQLRHIDRRVTKRVRDTLYQEGLAASTINHVVNTLSTILQLAEEDGIIPAVPRIYRAGGSGQSRGSLTIEEARTLFREGHWRDDRERIASMLAAVTGLRRSEILGLTRDRVRRDHIDVRRVWDRQSWRLKDVTKNEKPRIVPINKTMRRELARLIESSPHGRHGYVFYHDTNSAAPYDAQDITAGLYHALYSIGMTEERRKAERIDFHAWRHFANSRLVEGGIAETTVRAMIGHQSADMTLNYYHASDLVTIAGLQSDITDAR